MPKENNAYQLMTLITTHKLGDKAESIFKKHGLSLQYRLSAEGTASSDMMDVLGLGSVDKCVLLSVLPHAAAQDILGKLKRELRMHAVNSGIAFTVPLSGGSGLLLHLAKGAGEETERKDDKTMDNRTHALVVAMINRGFSGDVMEAAKAAGARGGTVVHSRCIGSAEASALLGLNTNEEKEIVLILTDAQQKTAIMEAVTAHCGAATAAKGLVLSLPVDSVTGF